MKNRNTLKNLLLPVILFLGLTFIAAKINQTGIPALVDEGSGATVGISYSHHEIHAGSHYFGKTLTISDGAELLAYAGPTVTDPGTTIWSSITGEGKSPIGVAPEMGYEIIAKRNTKYAFKIIKIPIQQPEWVDLDFWWYENSH